VTTVFDTGPLVAAIDRSDKHHARCAAFLENLQGTRLVPTTVLVEVCWLLEERPDVEAAFLESVASGEFEQVAIADTDLVRMGRAGPRLRRPAARRGRRLRHRCSGAAEPGRRDDPGPSAFPCRPAQARHRPEPAPVELRSQFRSRSPPSGAVHHRPSGHKSGQVTESGGFRRAVANIVGKACWRPT